MTTMLLPSGWAGLYTHQLVVQLPNDPLFKVQSLVPQEITTKLGGFVYHKYEN